MFSSFLQSKLLGTPRTSFNVIIRVLLKYITIIMQSLRRLSIFESDAVDGAIKTHHGPYDYRNIEQKVAEAETCERV